MTKRDIYPAIFKFIYGLISFLIGAVILSLFSILQKLIIGAPLVIKGFIVPFSFGGCSGFVIAIWRKNIKRYIKELTIKEEQIRNLIDNIHDMIQIVNPDGHFFYVNNLWKRLLGYSDEEIEKVERTVNACIRENITLEEKRDVPMPEAKKMGATALFGEKYGDLVRIIKFGESIELCGGNHVSATGKIGFFKIVSESAVAAGIRRIEAITSLEAENYIFNELKAFKEVKSVIKSSKNIKESIEKVLTENKKFKSLLEKFEKEKTKHLKQNLKNKIQEINGINVIAEKIEGANAQQLKDIAFQLKGEIVDLFFAAGIENNGKANLAVMISDNLIKNKGLNAGQIIREISKEIKGGGGGPAHFASAGGTDASGIERALEKATEFIK